MPNGVEPNSIGAMTVGYALRAGYCSILFMLAVPASAEPVKAEPRFATLILDALDVPAGFTFPAQQALLLGAQELAAQESLYYRVNATFPDAVDRMPACVSGTGTLLYAKLYVAHFAAINLDSVIVAVEASDCLGGNVVNVYLHSEVPKGGDLTSRIRSTASDAFKQFSDRLHDDPTAASGLGWPAIKK